MCWLDVDVISQYLQRWNTCNIGVGSFSILGGGGGKASEANFNMGECIAKCKYMHTDEHADKTPLICTHTCTRVHART